MSCVDIWKSREIGMACRGARVLRMTSNVGFHTVFSHSLRLDEKENVVVSVFSFLGRVSE